MEVLLIQKAKRHDKEAFSLLMHQHKQDMYKVARAILKNDEDVADAMQETILTCWEKIHTLKKNEYFKTWLIRILINHCNVIYRQNSRCIPNDTLPEIVVADAEYSNVEWKEMFQCLSERCRIVIVLYYVQGFKVKEIAGFLHISESAVKERLSSARKTIERCL